MRAYLWTHSTFQKPDKLLWMLRDRFEKASSSQGVLGQKIRPCLINALKYLIEHVWRIGIEQAVAAVEALQSFMRMLEGFRRRPAALLRRPEPGCAAGGRRDGDLVHRPPPRSPPQRRHLRHRREQDARSGQDGQLPQVSDAL